MSPTMPVYSSCATDADALALLLNRCQATAAATAPAAAAASPAIVSGEGLQAAGNSGVRIGDGPGKLLTCKMWQERELRHLQPTYS